MVTDEQVRRFFGFMKIETISVAAAKSGMHRTTAAKYGKLGKVPSELRTERSWRTRVDAFEGVWGELEEKLKIARGCRPRLFLQTCSVVTPDSFKIHNFELFSERSRSGGR